MWPYFVTNGVYSNINPYCYIRYGSGWWIRCKKNIHAMVARESVAVLRFDILRRGCSETVLFHRRPFQQFIIACRHETSKLAKHRPHIPN